MTSGILFFGPELLESVYQKALIHELKLRGFKIDYEVPIKRRHYENCKQLHRIIFLAKALSTLRNKQKNSPRRSASLREIFINFAISNSKLYHDS